MMKKRLRIGISFLIIILTIGLFVYYLRRHSYLIRQIVHTPVLTIVILLVLYFVLFFSLVLIMQATLIICKKQIDYKENFLLNAYSSLANFFIPGQSGIAVRAAYLKKTKKLAVRSFLFTTLIYYSFYAIISAILLFSDTKEWWLTPLAVLIVIGVSLLIMKRYLNKHQTNKWGLNINPKTLSWLFLATLLQAVVQVAIYAVELHKVDSHTSIQQVITYTGAANFALFVALTPGAIGIRESFLLFTRKLNHLTSVTIIAASVIDRAIFIIFLAILMAITFGFHTKYQFRFSDSDLKEDVDGLEES